MRSTALRFKAHSHTLAILQFYEGNLQAIEHQLQEWVEKTPRFFQGLPIIIDLQHLAPNISFNLAEISHCLRKHGCVPIGIQGGTTSQQIAAKELQLGLFPYSKEKTYLKEKAASTETLLNTINTPTPIIRPIRSGERIYTKGDLVIIGSVSPGAEVLAEGHIHIKGKLEGRALAGISDNKKAFIFCDDIEAQLVAIAGHYWLYEDLQKKDIKSNLYIYLDNDQLQIRSIKT